MSEAKHTPGEWYVTGSRLTGAQFAAAQHLQTVQVQAEALTALQAKCDLLSASLKQRDGLVDQLVAALKGLIADAECFEPHLRNKCLLDDARDALAAAGEAS